MDAWFPQTFVIVFAVVIIAVWAWGVRAGRDEWRRKCEELANGYPPDLIIKASELLKGYYLAVIDESIALQENGRRGWLSTRSVAFELKRIIQAAAEAVGEEE